MSTHSALSNRSYQYPFKDTDDATILAVWALGRIIPKFEPALWRWDACGSPIKYSDHGNTNSKYGWEIDHIYPRALGGQSTIDNVQPLQWENNRKKGDTYPWVCP